MTQHQKKRAPGNAGVNRRDFLRMAAAGGAGAVLAGCVTNPVTGRRQLMLMSENEEINIDRTNAPAQFSEDYGALKTEPVNRYVDGVGRDLAALTHRPQMPYSFRGVQASHINAYAFPGGSIAVTRGMLLKMSDEAQLAAVLGHELGHVNARHSASRMSKGLLVQLAVAGATIAVASRNEEYVPLAEAIGGLGAGLLLARYSRADERQADALGMAYMVKAGYNPEGMVNLMRILEAEHTRDPGALDLMFATHPMSRERRETAAREAQSAFASAAGLPVNRERYLDQTAPLRKYEGVVKNIQQGDRALLEKRPTEAEGAYRQALQQAPDDYEALVKMARCLAAQNRNAEARRYADQAKAASPAEAQGFIAAASIALRQQDFDGAHQDLVRAKTILPHVAGLRFLNGFALDRMGRRDAAAAEYRAYLQSGAGDSAASFAAQRLARLNAMP